MKIYTKTGDSGDTSLYDGKRLPKSSLRVDTYGTVDELNAQIGIVRSLKPPVEIYDILGSLQKQLFKLGSDLSAPFDAQKTDINRIQQDDIRLLEKDIDRLEVQMQPLASFILPGGSPVSAQLHAARAVCRRAERLVDALARKENIGNMPLIYLNRLADLLFVLARYANKLSGTADVEWKGSCKK